MSETHVVVGCFESRLHAEASQALLESAGITSWIEADDAGGVLPPLQLGGVRLLVGSEDERIAAQVLSSTEPPQREVEPEHAPDAERALERSPVARIGLLGPPLLDASLLFLLGALVGYLLSELNLFEFRRGVILDTGTVEVDENSDGQADVWLEYHGDHLVRSRMDRNFDGQPDAWAYLDSGLLLREETDDDFDGDVDVWLRYMAGRLVELQQDTDRNGISDGTTSYGYGVPVVTRLHPNGSAVEREHRYVDGVLKEVYELTPSGISTLTQTYDELGREHRPSP